MAIVPSPVIQLPEYGDEEHSLIVIPKESSALVKAEEKRLVESSIDLNILAYQFTNLGGFIKLAYYAMAATKSGNPEINKCYHQVREINNDVLDLTTETLLTVTRFESSSHQVLRELQSAYEFLLDSYEDEAVECFASLVKSSNEMAEEAKKLRNQFSAETKKVAKTLQECQKAKEDEEMHVSNLEKEQIVLEEQKKDAEARIEEAEDLERAARERKQDYQKLADAKDEKDSSRSFWKRFCDMFIPRDDPRWQEKSEDARREEEEQRKKRHDQMNKQVEFCEKLQQKQYKQSEIENAIECLHHVNSALKYLQVLMSNAYVFWSKLKDHCQQLADSGIKEQIQRRMNDPPEKRLKFWTANSFKRKAIGFYGQWVALNVMCKRNVAAVRDARDTVLGAIIINPTYDEAKCELATIAEEVGKHLKIQKFDIQALPELDSTTDTTTETTSGTTESMEQ